ncbi:uncharacterized protein PODANS_5_4840 [Podospora anserina S mat+]|uniref:Podospora anserina S mat+ genomic DNA chromosome 5, supercontig 5 n=2 Tax=Podospora anserina TaxID=2587412 RepID=B2AMT2_PODAN|nr:uncharacterized protein PODANS_5_4840 [Podospora anserina S mat+]CAD60570.1 unnamed protein product [Podospora anserina]CAP65248.1 unnamed protein product [Podospora anserina S mat+]CDP29460.1 Putative protein of unknown function [Podospora anserina S mat+]
MALSVFTLVLLFLFSSQANAQHRRWEPSTFYKATRPPLTIPYYNKTYACFLATAEATTTSTKIPATRVSVIPIDPIWTTLPIASLTGDPFCINEAAPHEGIGNHCVCQNGETLSVIPFATGGNVSDYQPCAYTTVYPDTTTSTLSQTLITCTMSIL